MIKLLLCRFLGHKEADFTDSGYAICARCGSHSYWDVEQWHLRWMWPPMRWYWQVRYAWSEWQDNREIARRLKGIDNGNQDDLPF